METKKGKTVGWKAILPVAAALAVLLAMSAVFVDDRRKANSRESDFPPEIEFTWTPLGEVDLKEFRGSLKMTDDHGLDFSSYRMTIVELGRTYDMPIPGMVGREYETPVSLGLLANDPAMAGKSRLTLRFEIRDDRGQPSSLERVVLVRPAPVAPESGVVLEAEPAE